MDMTVPLSSQEILSFQQIGVDTKFANISSTFLSQDKYLCIREVTDTGKYIVIVDLQNDNNVTKLKIIADTAVMNPYHNIIAAEGNSSIQVFDLSKKQRLNSFQLPNGQNVNYLKWIDDQTLAFISDHSIYHWSIEGQSSPNPIFKLQEQFQSGSIFNYSVSHDQQWIAISGKVREGFKVQLFSRERNASQIINACTASFANVGSLPLLVSASKENGKILLNISPLGSTPAAQQFGQKFVDISMDPDLQDDLPLYLIFSKHFNSAFLFTKFGNLYCFEIETPFVYISKKVSQASVIHANLSRDGGAIALFDDGRMFIFSLNHANIIDFIDTKCGNQQAAAKVANSEGLQILVKLNQQFDQLIQIGNYAEAALVAIKSPGVSLRNQATIEKFHRIPYKTGGIQPLFQYLMAILENTKLNEIESIEICKIVLEQNKTELIEKWIKEDKLTPTEELGDVCKQDPRISLAIYLRANVSTKIVASFAELEMFDKLQVYCEKFAYQPNWMQIATIIAHQSPEKITPILKHIANNGNPLVDPNALVQMLLQSKLSKAATLFLIEVLPQDREEDSELQTLLYEIAINNDTRLAEELFSCNCFSYYDHQRVAALCERAGDFKRALEHCKDLSTIKRCIVNTQSISQDFLIQYFDYMSPEWSLECLRELLKSNQCDNVQLVVTIAGKYCQKLGIDNLINLFNEMNLSNTNTNQCDNEVIELTNQ
ncbi:hypothetical protein M9Y10_026046 [Tritrichomonas musculus]|uniref:Clathrin heavy chain n=1 Tax=Tritrichomonas musculus TaxID=1915356 RepID=A0ABR2H8A4_9EUKA